MAVHPSLKTRPFPLPNPHLDLGDVSPQKTSQRVCCPNCGAKAERNYLVHPRHTRTECPKCDYLMITCSLTGAVIEAYAPGIQWHR